jgi:hypothetical protein
MSRAPGKYVAGTMAPAGAALDRPDLDAGGKIIRVLKWISEKQDGVVSMDSSGSE